MTKKNIIKLAVFLSVFFSSAAVFAGEYLDISNLRVKYGSVDVSQFTDPSYTALIEFDRSASPNSVFVGQPAGYPNSTLKLCATLRCKNPASTPIEINNGSFIFKVFKSTDSSNPVKSYIWDKGTPQCATTAVWSSFTGGGTEGSGEYCMEWDGSWAGTADKYNGEYTFRVEASVHKQEGSSISISEEGVGYYPNGENNKNVKVDVVNVGDVTSAQTEVGATAKVQAQPVAIGYRLSKAANVTADIYRDTGAASTKVRSLLATNKPASPSGSVNTENWNMRDTEGRLLSPGTYRVDLYASGADQWGTDTSNHAFPYTLSIDPIQFADLALKNIGATSNDFARVSYVLTEDAEVYWEIYTPGAVVNSPQSVPPVFSGGTLVRRFNQQQSGRTSSSIYFEWDGRDEDGNMVADGYYTYALWARTAGRNMDTPTDPYIYTSQAIVGAVNVSRGKIPLDLPVVEQAVIGSTTPVTGQDPFNVKYKVGRTANVRVRILKDNVLVRTFDTQSVAPNVDLSVEWDGRNDDGYRVALGEYTAEVTAWDPERPTDDPEIKTAKFNLNLFRITDISSTPLGSVAASVATITYLPTQTMTHQIDIYDQGVSIPTTGVWPPNMGANVPVRSFTQDVSGSDYIDGVKQKKNVITERWDGTFTSDPNESAYDGDYPFVITAWTSNVAVYNSTGYTLAAKYYATDRITGTVEVARDKVYIKTGDSNAPSITPTVVTASSSTETADLAPYQLGFETTRLATVVVKIKSSYCTTARGYTENGVCVKLFDGIVYGDARKADSDVRWYGTDEFDEYLPEGHYEYEITANHYPDDDNYLPSVYSNGFYYAPLRIWGMSILDAVATMNVKYTTSVAMKTAIQIFKPGTKIDRDDGSVSPPLSESLVKVIRMDCPPMTLITNYWDGTDRQGVKVPRGNYEMRVVSSTGTNHIDYETGEIDDYTNVADKNVYRSPQKITVTVGSPFNVCEEFKNTVLFYPNPIRTATGYFRMNAVPVTGNYKLNVYNIAQDLVYQHDWGRLSPSSTYPNIELAWNKVNASGRALARGVYFAVFEMEGAEGGGENCQAVKKILIP